MEGRNNRLRLRGIPNAAVAALTAAVLVPGADAATQTLGTLAPDGTAPADCAAGNTWVERSAATGTPSYTAPATGVITSWSVMGGGASAQVKLKVLQVAASGDSPELIARGDTAVETVASGVTSTFATRTPIQRGHQLGLAVIGGTAACRYPTATNEDSTRKVVGEPPVGSSSTFEAPTYQERLSLTAVVEDDADGDGFGDETQDLCPSSASTQETCPPTINDPAGRVYVALGDSWSQGVGASSEATNWVHLLFNHFQSSIGANVLSNRSIGGQSTQQVIDGPQLSNALADVNAPSDTLAVTLQIGGNDGRFGCRDECFQRNHAAILAALHGALDSDPGEELLITGGYGNPSSGLGNNNESAAELGLFGQNLSFSCADREPDAGLLEAISQNAGRYGALFADPYPGFKQGGQSLMSGDGVHPNDAGHAVVEAAFEAAVPGCGDEIPPLQTLTLKAKQHLDDVMVTDAVDEAAKVVVAGKVPLPGKDAKFQPAGETLMAPGTARLSPKLKGKALRKAEAAMEQRKLEARLIVTATDPAGNASVEKRTVALKG